MEFSAQNKFVSEILCLFSIAPHNHSQPLNGGGHLQVGDPIVADVQHVEVEEAVQVLNGGQAVLVQIQRAQVHQRIQPLCSRRIRTSVPPSQDRALALSSLDPEATRSARLPMSPSWPGRWLRGPAWGSSPGQLNRFFNHTVVWGVYTAISQNRQGIL